MQRYVFAVAVALMVMTATTAFAADGKHQEDGKYLTKDDVPTYNVKQDGTVDWYTYSGFRRYHSECHVCHGPDGLGSSIAPALVESMKTISYADFLYIVAAGRERITASVISKMPGFGENKNVACFIDDLYVYLKARSDGAIPRGRPRKRDIKPATAKAYENECFEG